jgi:hypothetical protein
MMAGSCGQRPINLINAYSDCKHMTAMAGQHHGAGYRQVHTLSACHMCEIAACTDKMRQVGATSPQQLPPLQITSSHRPDGLLLHTSYYERQSTRQAALQHSGNTCMA